MSETAKQRGGTAFSSSEQESCAPGGPDRDGAGGEDGTESRSLRPIILAKIAEVAASQDKMLAPLTDDLVLLDSGLDSLCFAIIVATLEDELGFDPFTTSEDVYFPVTVGDFVQFYDNAVR